MIDCPDCGRSFTRSDNLSRHRRNACKTSRDLPNKIPGDPPNKIPGTDMMIGRLPWKRKPRDESAVQLVTTKRASQSGSGSEKFHSSQSSMGGDVGSSSSMGGDVKSPCSMDGDVESPSSDVATASTAGHASLSSTGEDVSASIGDSNNDMSDYFKNMIGNIYRYSNLSSEQLLNTIDFASFVEQL